jgi:hypothetical protein
MLYTINDSEEITNLVEGLVINDGNKTISKKRSRDSVFRNNVYNSHNTILTSLNIILRTNHFIKIIRNWRVNMPRDMWYRKFECGEVLFFY